MVKCKWYVFVKIDERARSKAQKARKVLFEKDNYLYVGLNYEPLRLYGLGILFTKRKRLAELL